MSELEYAVIKGCVVVGGIGLSLTCLQRVRRADTIQDGRRRRRREAH